MLALAVSRQGILAGLAVAGVLATVTVPLADLPIASPPLAKLLAGEPAEPTRYHPGDFVVVTRRAELKVESNVVDTADEGLLLGVDRVDGDWLWVTNNKSGWLHRSSVIPARQAVELFTSA